MKKHVIISFSLSFFLSAFSGQASQFSSTIFHYDDPGQAKELHVCLEGENW